MGRLIDADRALEVVFDQGLVHPNAYHLTNYATLILREAPTVDAVEVVRCRECKHRDGIPGQPNIVCSQMHDDDFCSYGERKECAGNG